MKQPLLIFIALFVFLLAGKAEAQEDKFKAIFLYKLIENTRWPNDKKDLAIGVVGNTQLTDEFQKLLELRKLSNLTIKKIKPGEAATYDVVYLTSSNDKDFNSIYASTKGQSILLVTENADMAKRGASVCFQFEGNKLGYVLNRSTLTSCKLKMTEYFVRLAREVI